MSEYSQGICQDGAAILKDGAMLTIEEMLMHLRQHDRLLEVLSELCSHLPETTDWSLESMAIDEARALLKELEQTK